MTAHDQEDIFRYLSGELPASEKDRIEAHLKDCAECSDLLAFVRDFDSSLKAIPPEELQPDTPCPDADTIASFAANELDESTARSVRLHTIFCKSCLEEVFLLRRAAVAAGVRPAPASSVDAAWWRTVFEKAKDFVIDMGRAYGQGALIGPARITADQPMFALRGARGPESLSKVLEIAIGANTYSVEVKLDRDRALSFDIAGVRTPVPEPLRIVVYSQQGAELASAQSSTSGNCHLAAPSASDLNDFLIFSFALKEAEQSFLIRFPQTQRST